MRNQKKWNLGLKKQIDIAVHSVKWLALMLLPFGVFAESHTQNVTYYDGEMEYNVTIVWNEVSESTDGLLKNKFTIESFKPVLNDQESSGWIVVSADELMRICDFSEEWRWSNEGYTNYSVKVSRNAFQTEGTYDYNDINFVSDIPCTLILGEKAFCKSHMMLSCDENVMLDIRECACAYSSIWYFPWDKVCNVGNCAFQGYYGDVDLRLMNVTNIGVGAFQQASLASIEFGEGLKRISAGAFYECSSLTNILINSNAVVNVGDYAFSRSGLKSIELPERSVFDYNDSGYYGYDYDCNFTSGFSYSVGDKIYQGLFSECSALQRVLIPNTFWSFSLPAYCFADCSALQEYNIAQGIIEIGYGAFRNCKSLCSLGVPASVEHIKGTAVVGCSSLKSLNLTSVKYVDAVKDEYQGYFSSPQYKSFGAFEGCTSLQSVVFSDALQYLSESIFNGCTSLKEVVLPNSIKQIPSSAFKGCTSLQILNWPSALEIIGEDAFKNCSELATTLVVSDVITNIASTAFVGTLINMRVAPDTTIYRMNDGVLLSTYSNQPIWTPCICVNVISTDVRSADPTILDVKYIVRGGYDKVNVRALAFEDGTRSWAKVVRPETFVATPTGAASVIGNGVDVNVTNAFSWKVSADYTNNLAKLKVEIFVQTDDLLPLDLMTIPAYNGKPALEFSCNTLTDANVMNALYWLYADNDGELTLNGGELKFGSVMLAKNDALQYKINSWSTTDLRENAADYVIRKMGYQRLTTANYLDYVNSETRLGLSPSGIRQYAVKEVE